MTAQQLDLTGTISPYCLRVVEKHARNLKPSDELVITCDHIPAATTIIPQMARDLGLEIDGRKVSARSWEIHLSRK